MASRLSPCPSCTRHVKVGSASCPFCGGAVPTQVPRRTFAFPPGKPLTRAAALFAGAAAVTACGEVASSPPATSSIDGSAIDTGVGGVPLYGAFARWDAGIEKDAGIVVPDSATAHDSGEIEDAGDDVWWTPVEYGPAAVFDAGFGLEGGPDGGTSIPDAEAEQDAGQGNAAYGGFVRPDGGQP